MAAGQAEPTTGAAGADRLAEPPADGASPGRRSLLARVATTSGRPFSVTEASLLLMATSFVSAALGALRQVLLNRQFGADETAGAYYAASRLPDAVFALVAGGALSSAFIPVLVATRREEGDAAAWRLAGLVLNTLTLGLALVALLGQVAAPALVERLLVPGYSAEGQATATALTRIMLLQPVILGAGTVVTALLQSRNRFLLPALGVAAHNLGVLAGVGASMAVPTVGIWGPACGVVLGSLLQVAMMLPGLRGEWHGRAGRTARWRPVLDLGDRRLREVGRLLVPNGLSMGVNYAGFVAEAAFASRLGDAAAIPALHNAWLLAGLPVTLLGHGIGQASFPRLAAHAAAGDTARLRATLRRTLGVALALSLAGTAGLLLFGGPLARILFEHGRYGADATDLTRLAVTGYAVGLPAYVATEIAGRAILAGRDARTPLLSNLVQLGLRLGLMASLVPPLGLVGIPLAMAGSSVVEASALVTLALRRSRRPVPDPAGR